MTAATVPPALTSSAARETAPADESIAPLIEKDGDKSDCASFAKLIGQTSGHEGEDKSPPSPPQGDANKGKDSDDKSKASALVAAQVAVPLVAQVTPLVVLATANAAAPTSPGVPPQPDTSARTTEASGSTPVDETKNVLVLPDVPATKAINQPELPGQPVRSEQTQGAVSPPRVPETTRSTDDQPPDQPVAAGAGTSSAIVMAHMKMLEKEETSSRSAEKNLPLGNSLPAATPRGTAPSVKSSAGPTEGRKSNDLESPLSVPAALSQDRTLPDAGVGRAETARPPQVEKVFAEVAERVVSFKRVGADSAEVSLRPDRGTEITLQMSVRNGQVQVVARLERGNFDSLNARWGDLQQTLSQQGVRVSNLQHTTLNTRTGQQDIGGQPQRRFGREPEGLDELPPGGTMTEPLSKQSPRTAARNRRGWEMWA